MLASREGVRVQVQLQDILALVVGYGMAAVLFRAFWPAHPALSFLGLPGAGLYLWLGLAMSGPIIILRRGLSRPAAAPGDPSPEGVPAWDRPLSGAATPRPLDPSSLATGATWAERAWLLIGAYWIILGVFVIPVRLHEFKLGDVLLFGLAPIVVAIGLRLLGPRIQRGSEVVRGWTHTAAIALVATWPLAWVCLIVLGQSLH